MRHSPANRNTKPNFPNFSESFYITRERAADHPDIVAGKPHVMPNCWPSNMPAFRGAMIAYYATMEAMTRRLVPAFAAALDLSQDLFRRGLCRAALHVAADPSPLQPDPPARSR